MSKEIRNVRTMTDRELDDELTEIERYIIDPPDCAMVSLAFYRHQDVEDEQNRRANIRAERAESRILWFLIGVGLGALGLFIFGVVLGKFV